SSSTVADVPEVEEQPVSNTSNKKSAKQFTRVFSILRFFVLSHTLDEAMFPQDHLQRGPLALKAELVPAALVLLFHGGELFLIMKQPVEGLPKLDGVGEVFSHAHAVFAGYHGHFFHGDVIEHGQCSLKIFHQLIGNSVGVVFIHRGIRQHAKICVDGKA
ncbi:tRNA-specific adenosine deaminase, partial [Dysosmobacter welbionis]